MSTLHRPSRSDCKAETEGLGEQQTNFLLPQAYVRSPQKQLGQHGRLLLSFLISFYTFPLCFLTSCAVDSLFLLQFLNPIGSQAVWLAEDEKYNFKRRGEKGGMWQVDFETAFLPVLKRTWVEAVALGTYFFAVQKWKLIAEIRDSMNCQAGRCVSCRQWKDGNSKKLALLRAGLYISVQWSPCIGSQVLRQSSADALISKIPFPTNSASFGFFYVLFDFLNFAFTG